MKKFNLFAFAALAALTLGSCSDDNPVKEGSENGSGNLELTDGAYFAIDIQMPVPTGSRSYTDTPSGNVSTSDSGIEYGKDYENTVNNAMVVLARYTPSNASTNYAFITAAQIPTSSMVSISTDNSFYRATAKFSKTDLEGFYNQVTERNIQTYIFVFCNPSSELTSKFFGENATVSQGNTDWINTVLTYNSTNTTVWVQNGFPMANSNIAVRQLPPTLDDWDYYTSESKPFDLSGANNDIDVDNSENNNRGSVRVERYAARFDFRDGSIDGKTDTSLNGIGDFTYEVVYGYANADDENQSCLINVQLKKMYLVNVNQKYYALRHVSSNGLVANSSICMPELSWRNGATGNYVVDANAAWKQQTVNAFDNSTTAVTTWPFSDNYMSPFFNDDLTTNQTSTDGRWSTYLCSSIVNGTEDNDDDWNSNHASSNYYIWRYATENVIPGPSTNQTNGLSTGVVFKARLIPTDAALNSNDPEIKELAYALKGQTVNGASLTGSVNNDPILYQFNGSLYCHWTGFRDAAIRAAATGFYKNSEGEWEVYNLNRSNSLFAAVFGKGGMGTVTLNANIVNPENGEITETQEITFIDTEPQDQSAPDYCWNQWKAALNTGASNNRLAEFKKAATGSKITLYQVSEDNEAGGLGYFCYYYYWNRHNDNGNNGVMGPMEFAVVRNNVYKLAVTNISKLGHPRVPSNDPDVPTPDTPDESQDIYLTVTAEVNPWCVRVNNIQF